jgi:hypothetical protein
MRRPFQPRRLTCSGRGEACQTSNRGPLTVPDQYSCAEGTQAAFCTTCWDVRTEAANKLPGGDQSARGIPEDTGLPASPFKSGRSFWLPRQLALTHFQLTGLHLLSRIDVPQSCMLHHHCELDLHL